MKPFTATCINEAEVESKLIAAHLLPALGYDPESWSQQVKIDHFRLDFVVTPTKKLRWCVAIEAKGPNEDLNKHTNQLKNYLDSLHLHYGLLVNDKEIFLYQRTPPSITRIDQFKVSNLSQEIDRLRSYIGRRSLQRFAQDWDNQLAIVKNGAKPFIADFGSTKTISRGSSSNSFGGSMKTIAVYHNKGGVGKTTTVVNLAAALARQAYRVLIIDLDSQANTTFATGLARFTDEEDDNIKDCNILHVLTYGQKYDIESVVRQASYCNHSIDVIPSHIDLMPHETTLNNIDPVRKRLRNKLEAVQEKYDYVLIDTPPSLNLYARIAMVAADYLIIPSDLKPFANEGLKNVKEFLNDVNSFRDDFSLSPIQILGVLPSKISTNVKFIHNTLLKREDVIRERYGLPVLKSRIFEREDLSKSVENSIEFGDIEVPDPKSIFDFSPKSQSADEFNNLAKEVMTAIQVTV